MFGQGKRGTAAAINGPTALFLWVVHRGKKSWRLPGKPSSYWTVTRRKLTLAYRRQQEAVSLLCGRRTVKMPRAQAAFYSIAIYLPTSFFAKVISSTPLLKSSLVLDVKSNQSEPLYDPIGSRSKRS